MENTNNIHYKPILFLWENYIYCFSEQNNSIIAERTLFSKKNEKWENISLNFISENELLENNIEFKNNINQNILIIFENKKIFFYNPLNNNIKNIDKDDYNYDFEICQNDKNAYNINKYYSICIPDNFANEKNLIVLNRKNRIFHKMNFMLSDNSLKIKHQFEESEKINNENNIIIKVEFANFLDFGTLNFDKYDEKNIDDNNNNNNDFEDKLFELKKVPKTLKSENEINKENIENVGNEIIKEEYSFNNTNENNENNDYKSHTSKNILIIPNNIAYEQLIHRTSDNSQIEEDFINLYDNSNEINDNKTEKILIPKKHNLSSILTKKDKDNNNDNFIFDELVIENKNGEDNTKEKIIKQKVNLLLSKDSLDENLVNREILNDIEEENLNNDNKNNSVIKPIKRKLEGMEIKENNDDNSNNNDNYNENNENGGMLDDVFSFDAFEYNGDDNKERDEMKNSIIFKSKINLMLSQNSIEDQILNRNIDLEGKNNDKDI